MAAAHPIQLEIVDRYYPEDDAPVIEPPMYVVPSSNMDCTDYLLEVHPGNDATCSCPSHAACKHVGAHGKPLN